jgi:adenylate cyclase
MSNSNNREQILQAILRSTSDYIILIDKTGHIILANDSAKWLLGRSEDEQLEGRLITDLIQLKQGNLAQWLQAALERKNEKQRQQYYPDQTLNSQGRQHSINLSINAIADPNDANNIWGALLVMDDISDEKRLKSTIYRYMTQEVAEELLKLDDGRLGGDVKEVSVLFSSIHRYATLTERLEAQEVVRMLNDYFETMVEAIFMYKGTVDKYIDDAIRTVFGSPFPLVDHAWKAVQTAVEMRYRLADFNASRISQSREPIRIGIGINSDRVISGNIGTYSRMEFTVIGAGAKLATRLEGFSQEYGCDIIISDTTYRLCADRIWVRKLDQLRVNGQSQPLTLYELVGLRSEAISDWKQQAIELYHKGREYYLNRKFTRAMNEFGTILEELDPNDKAAALYFRRCRYFIQNPPADDWDGIGTFTER